MLDGRLVADPPPDATASADRRHGGAVLVTGAAGFVGRHLVGSATRAGHNAVGVDVRHHQGPPDRATSVRTTFSDPAVLRDVRAGRYAAVLHQAAITDTMADDWTSLRRTNVCDGLQLAEACAVSDTLLVYASSFAVYGTITRRDPVPEDALDVPGWCTGPLNAYGRSKLEFDAAMARRFPDARWVGLRYTNVFGTGEEHKGRMASIISQLLTAAAHGAELRLFSDTLQACRDYVPVDHVAAVVTRLLHTSVPTGVYNLGAGSAISFAQLLDWFAAFREDRQLRVRLEPNPVPDRYQYWTCADVSRLGRLVGTARVLTPDEVRAAALGLFRAVGARPRPTSVGSGS